MAGIHCKGMNVVSDSFCSSCIAVLVCHPLVSCFVTPIFLAPEVAFVNLSFNISRVFKKKCLHQLFFSQMIFVHFFCGVLVFFVGYVCSFIVMLSSVNSVMVLKPTFMVKFFQ